MYDCFWKVVQLLLVSMMGLETDELFSQEKQPYKSFLYKTNQILL